MQFKKRNYKNNKSRGHPYYLVYLTKIMIILFAGFQLTTKNCLAATSSSSGDGISDLGMTFYKIIKCSGYISFLIGYVDFLSSLQGGDVKSMSVPARKMFTGAILCCVQWFLRSFGAWDSINNGTTIRGIDTMIDVICKCVSLCISGIGVLGTISGVQKFFTSYTAHDTTGMISNARALFVGILVTFAAGVASFLEFNPT